MKGTTPAGAATEREAAEWVRAMFGRVARRYDLALQRYESFETELGPELTRFAVSETIRRMRKARGFEYPPGTGEAQRNRDAVAR